MVDGVLNGTIISAFYGDMENFTEYSPTNPICVDPTGCYRAVLFDQQGDGFVGSGGLVVGYNGTEVLNVGPGNPGFLCTGCITPGTIYYTVDFGNCGTTLAPSSATATTAPVAASATLAPSSATATTAPVAAGATLAPSSAAVPEACYDLDLNLEINSNPQDYLLVIATEDLQTTEFTQNVFAADTSYSATENEICLDPSGCYYIFLYDDDVTNTGFTTGGIELNIEGTTILNVSFSDPGTPCAECNGTSVVFWGVKFGNCISSTPAPTTSVISVPAVPSPTTAPVASPTNTTAVPDGTCMSFFTMLQIDQNPEDYTIVMFAMSDFDENGVIDSPMLTGNTFEAGGVYIVTDADLGACLDPNECYAFIVYDSGLDGFVGSGGITVDGGGSTILNIPADDISGWQPLTDGSQWFAMASFGNCAPI
jgi:hypothetical protein